MKIIAHRGASAEAPENTVESVQRAIDLEVHVVEIDVHLSHDGIPVVIHDETLKDGRRVEDLEWEELKSFIPRLKDILSINRDTIQLFIEIKKSAREIELAERVVEEVKDLEHIVIGSFSHNVIKHIQKIAPESQLLGIAMDNEAIKGFIELGIGHFAVSHKIATKELFDELEKVWVFTVDDIDEGHKLFALGAQGNITNNPRAFLKK